MTLKDLEQLHIGTPVFATGIYLGKTAPRKSNVSEFTGRKVDRTADVIRAVADYMHLKGAYNQWSEVTIDLHDDFELVLRRVAPAADPSPAGVTDDDT